MKKIYIICLLLAPLFINAQTDTDGIMMSKNNFCFGAVYQYSSWNEYWEGTFKRENLNLGTVSTKSIGLMGNYGITGKLNIMFTIPYVETHASAGTLAGKNGFQDFSFATKYRFVKEKIGKSIYSFYAIGSFSIPLSDYSADYLPLSLGLKSKTASLRLMSDFQRGHFFSTLSVAYIKRANINIERDSYYTDEIHYTNKVDMPDAISSNLRIGYKSNRLIAEAVIDNSVTQSGGFDITTNNMPFPSNTMNALKIGVNTKYTPKKMPAISIVAGCNFVTQGRNVGESNTLYGGLFYLVKLKKTAQKNEK